MKAFRPLLRLGVLVMVGVLALTGGSGLTGAARAQDRKPIVIGASIAVTGHLGLEGIRMKEGYQWWQDQVNKKGGLLGRPVEIKFYDDQSTPATGAKLYERLITEDKVDLVLGPYHSAVTFAVAPIVEKHGIPMVASGSASLTIFSQGYKNVFMAISPVSEYVRGPLELGKKQGLQTVAILNENLTVFKDMADQTEKIAKELGMKVVVREEYPSKVTDFSAPLSKIKAARPDLLIGCTNFPDAVNITKQMKDLDVDVKVYASSVGPAIPEFYKNLGKTAEFVYGASQWEPKQAGYPGHKEFLETFIKQFGHEPDYHHVLGAKGAYVFQKVIEKVGSLDKDRIREALRTSKFDTPWGPYAVDDRGVQLAHKMVVVQWLDGQKQVVWPEAQATAKPRFPTPAWRARK